MKNSIVKDDNIRLDVYLQSIEHEYTRSKIKSAIELGSVSVNGRTETKAGYKLRLGDQLEYEIISDKPLQATPQNIGLDIVYEDDDIIVINKPQGMVVHPAVGNKEGTLVNALLYHTGSLSSINGEIRAGIVHRIDKDTSGLLVVAKNDYAHNALAKQIADKTCHRCYLALLQGRLKQDSGEVITSIGRDPRNRLRMAVVSSGTGKVADTLYKAIKYYQGYTLCEFQLKTGRTHQIRVHSSYLGHPIVGDKLYNPNPCKFKLQGQLLHAYKLILTHPKTGQIMTFEAPLPDYFNKVLSELKESE